MNQVSYQVKTSKQILCLDYEREDGKTYEVFFLLIPTWRIQPQHFPTVSECDFALGCWDYLLKNPARYKIHSEYLSGYRASKELISKLSIAQYYLN